MMGTPLRTFVVAMSFLCFLGVALAVHAEVTDMGEVCFVLNDGTVGLQPRASLGLLSYGEGHFALHGTIDDVVAVSGTAALTGANITVSLSSSTASDNPLSGSSAVYHMVLDAATLAGPFTKMGFLITAPSSGGPQSQHQSSQRALSKILHSPPAGNFKLLWY